jgi:uncharacterized protein (TIGR02265 family)
MKIKGLVINTRKAFVIEHFGQDGWERVVNALPMSDQKLFRQGLFAAQWYPFEIGRRLDKAIVQVLGGGKDSVFEALGAKSAQQSLNREHKPFLAPGDPQAFMKNAPVIYRFYYDTGYREYEETGPNSGVMTTYDSETYSAPDCLTVIGWYKEALMMCGAKTVRVVEEECRAKGGTCCRYRFTWSM